MNEKLSNLRKSLKEKNLEGALIYKNENRRYFSGFSGSSGYVFITLDHAFFITDFRYIQQSMQECVGYEIIEHNNSRSLYAIIGSMGLHKIGFEDDFVTYSQYREFTDKLNHIHWTPLGDTINLLRMIKSTDEIQNIEDAAAIADLAFDHICRYIKPGKTELEIALELESFMKKNGATGTSFESIVASGVRSSLPHGVASNKVIEDGDLITLDFGCIYKGYCSDMTRTVVVGKANNKQREIYDIVLQAQLMALETIKPGVSGIEVDKVARDYIASKGYGINFGHGLGHGVGLEIHEAPRLSPQGKDILQPGMVITDEPGIYLPDFGGVRIEDLVVVTKDGNRVLSKSPKVLIEL